jgi:hypothetical protein
MHINFSTRLHNKCSMRFSAAAEENPKNEKKRATAKASTILHCHEFILFGAAAA